MPRTSPKQCETRRPAGCSTRQLRNSLWRASPAATAEKLSSGHWRRAPHLDLLSRLLVDAAYGDHKRVLVSMPPRHGKSELVSHWFPVWYLSLFPEARVMLASYEADFAAHWGRKVRATITEHRAQLGVWLSRESTAANRWQLAQGGSMVTAGVGGPLTGKGGDLIVIDDPVKNFAEALSPTYRERTWEWYTSTARTRLEPGGAVVVVMTRWHEDDLAGRLLEQSAAQGLELKHVRLPAVAEDDDPLGRNPGAALWPERYDERELAATATEVGSAVWAGLYQQRPSPAEGGMLQRSWLRYWRTLPSRFDESVQAWDLAFKGDADSSFVVGQIWGRRGADCYLIDQYRAQVDFPGTLAAFEAMVAKHPAARRKGVEDKASGRPLIDSLRAKIPGIVPLKASTSKEARFASVTPLVESGNVHLPDPRAHPWVLDLVEELVTFPRARNDDQCDAFAHGLNMLANSALERLRRLAQR